MSRQPVRTFFPQTRLSELAARPGGILRSDAIESAQSSIESLRGQGDETIMKSLGAIEAVVYAARSGPIPDEGLHKILRLADQIVTLAGTFQYDVLDRVARSLCDLTDGLVQSGQNDAAPVAVHVQSMRLVAPGSAALADVIVEHMLSELARVIAHFDFSTLAMPGIAEDGEIVLAAR